MVGVLCQRVFSYLHPALECLSIAVKTCEEVLPHEHVESFLSQGDGYGHYGQRQDRP